MPITYSVQSPATFPAPTDDRRVIVGDFDNDGDSDLIVQSGGNGSAFVYFRSNGNGTFTQLGGTASPIAGLIMPNHNGANYYVGDFDGDGDQDVWGAVAGATGAFFRNDNGKFVNASALSFPDLTTVDSYAVGDFDNDGDTDILGQTPGILGLLGTVVYWESNGDGTFTERTQAQSPFQGLNLGVLDLSSQAMQVGDFDGDGDDDLWVASTLSLGNYYENNGDGTFSSQIALGLLLPQLLARITVADFDSDGDDDILAQLGINGSGYTYLRSDGNGNFTALTQAQSPFAGVILPDNVDGTFHTGDFDGDGDVDLWAANGGPNGTYYMQDGSPPSLDGVSVVGDPANAVVDLTFDEPVTRGEGNIYLIRQSDGAVIGTVSVTSAQVVGGGVTWRVDFPGSLATGTGYSVRFDTGAFVDVDGAVTMAGDSGDGGVFITSVANDDAITVADDGQASGDLKADNGSGADQGVLAVTAVNGQAAAVGTTIQLPSGALLTVNANGTYRYNPNGAFTYLAAANSGASDISATDTFTYTVNGGDTATVTVTINGRDNADIAEGTAGNDTIRSGLGNDVVNGLGGHDTLFGMIGDDILNGGDGADILYGGAGTDTMAGGAGDDIFFVEESSDIVVELLGQGNDRVRSNVSYVLGANIENLQLDAAGALNGTGNALANVIDGGSGNNILSGEEGNDLIKGNAGNDTLYGGAGADQLVGGLGADALDGGDDNDRLEGHDGDDNILGGAGNDLIDGGGNNDVLSGGVGNDQLFGDDATDSLDGGDGNDVLNGGFGADAMTGGLGDDVYVVDNVGDTVVEQAGQGNDQVKASITHTLAANIETLIQEGVGNINGTGNALNNTLNGNAGNNVLDGGDGVDVLKGGLGNDTLIGGRGSDTLVGGGGNDRFLIRQESIGAPRETDTVNDFIVGDGDRIDLSAIDANSLLAGDQAFVFVSSVTTGAGQATLTYDAATGSTLLRLYVDGNTTDDYQMKIVGDVTGTMSQVLTGGEPATTGGWIL